MQTQRTLTAVFRRDRSKDSISGSIRFEGYEIFWPNGRPAGVGVEAFCHHGQRLLSLGRFLDGRQEHLIQLICFPLSNPESPLNRLPGYRVRRLYIERQGSLGRIHFLDGTPTTLFLEIGRDEPEVLHWIGLDNLEDGQRQWFDLAASPMPKSD
jgi:hypothetical protein